MTSSHKRILITTFAALTAVAVAARADLAPWMQSAIGGSDIEAALYRMMDLPGLRMLYPRPPAEARKQLDALVAAKPEAELFALRAHVDEQALDFAAAEQDWQAYVSHAQEKTAAELELADFYHRRNLGAQEISALEAAAALPSTTADKFLPADQQPAWKAFARTLSIAHDQTLPDDTTISIYKLWLARYPTEPAARANFIAALLTMRRFDDAQQTIDDYKSAFPQDPVLPIKAAALLAFDEGTPDATNRALALFDRAYQPLWPDDLVATYFDLLNATHSQHAFLAAARAQLQQNPDDLIAATKIFACYRQQGRMDAAVNSLTAYNASKDARHASWTANELYTFAILLDRAGQSQDAARYYFALASNSGQLTTTSQSSEEAGLTGLIHELLSDSDQSIALGSGNLAIYRDIATLDHGPGYLNGILSLWLNSQNPAAEFAAEEQKATPYFHREKAAELLALLDQRFPTSASRAELHAELIRAYQSYGQDAAVRDAGLRFLTDFPTAPERLEIALDVADADARTNDTKSEFALYDSLLNELAINLQGMPLTAAGNTDAASSTPPDLGDGPTEDSTTPDSTAKPTAAALLQQSLNVAVTAPASTASAAAYAQVLNRYLGRLTTTGQLPAALAVLRRELDRNPNDPLLYERLAEFLQQNNLAAQEEEVYQRAIDRFNSAAFYDKLARFYLRSRRQQSFDQLTRKVVDIFQGTDLEQYFSNVKSNWPQEYLQLNLYAHTRFPHDLAFTRNLLSAYRAKGTADPIARAQLLREHWQDSTELQAEFFDDLSRNNQLTSELTALQALVPTSAAQQQDPAAAHELAEIDIWRSHFEQSAPLLGRLAEAYPADAVLGDEAVGVYRSLAYFDPAQAGRAVAIEQRLSAADPTDLDRLTTIGDIYADSGSADLNLDTTQQLAQAATFWRRMSAIHPGSPDGYMQSATVFWDYFQFDDALAQIRAARHQFRNPALFGYEAGAIDEAKHDDAQAISEYVAACIGDSDEDGHARARLLVLAERPQYSTLIDQATAAAVNSLPSVAALDLRFAVLTTLHRQSELSPAVETAITHAAAGDLDALAGFALAHELPQAYQAALLRQIAISEDPVQQIELNYQLAHSEEDQGNIAAAQRVIETVYAANPKLVGVVRATVDFYWNHKQPQRAVATLVTAALQANSTLTHDYTLEAISKSNQSGDFDSARKLLQPLLATDPFNAQYLDLQAQSFSLAHNAAGVRDLYTTTLAALQATPLSASDRRDKIALARRGLIPALTDLKDYDGAIAQHTALISAFPEDDNTLQAAVSYARLHGREPQLVAFLNQAVAASPRDSRFAIDLGRVDLQLEDYPGALAAYSKAIAIRGDRADLFITRADLEEHQQAFDAACSDYDHLYRLSYNDPQWMEKAALARARQGKPDLAVKALQSAWIDGRPAAAANQFRVAQQLERWNMLAQADAFVSQGLQLAGDDLLANPDDSNDAVIYARLLARERKAPEALALLTRALQSSSTSPSAPSVIVQQIEKKGIADVTDSQWRAQLVAARQQRAQSAYRNAVLQLAAVAAEFYTPEEKSAFATLLDSQHAASSPQDLADLWIPAAKAAGLKDREAAWRREILLHGGKLAAAQLEPFDTLEAARMDNTVRAETLDAYAAQLKSTEQAHALTMAAAAWHDADNVQRETLDVRKLAVTHREQQNQQRLFEIYLHGDPAALLQLAATQDSSADAAVNFVVSSGTEQQTLKMIAARTSATPLWRSANTALAGLYFGDSSPAIDAAFQSTLGDVTIGQHLASKPDNNSQLSGDPWFYYGARYGLFLTRASKPSHDPEDYLPAQLELAPSNPASYSTLAQTYKDAHQVDAAIAEYRHAIELDPGDPSPQIAIAEALWSDGRHDAAIAAWNDALGRLREMVDLDSVPEEFWTGFASIASDAHADNLGTTLKPGMDTVLAAYLRKNGNYRSTELLQSAWTALATQNSPAAAAWVLSLVDEIPASDQLAALTELAAEPWFPASQLDGVYRREIALAQPKTQAATPPSGDNSDVEAVPQLISVQTTYLHWLLDHNRVADAATLFDSIPVSQRSSPELEALAVLLAARQGRLSALLDDYTTDPATEPTLDTLSNVANTLHLQKDFANSRLLLEYLFQQKLQQQALADTDYLALAEARIATNDIPGALDLLHRITLQGDLYKNLDSAAALLERTGHTAEALPLLTKLANGTPWNAVYRLRLGEAQLALQQPQAVQSLTTVASGDDAPYSVRAAAAQALHNLSGVKQLNSEELTLLANAAPAPPPVTQPYFIYIRIAAASAAPPAQRVPILRAAIAFAPDSLLNGLRLQLFQAEIVQGHFAQASVAISTVLATNPSLRTADDGANSLPNAADRRRFLLSLAEMDEHLADSAHALDDLQAAQRLSADDAQAADLGRRIATLQDSIALENENASRRPILQSNSLDQSNIVRPHLSAITAGAPQ